MRLSRTIPGWLGIAMLLSAAGCMRANTAEPDAIPFTQATVEARASDGGTIYHVEWMAPGVSSINVSFGPDPDHIDLEAGTRTGADFDLAMPKTDRAGKIVNRWYVKLVPDHGAPLVITDRNLALASAPNFRDAGGYRTADGKWVRMGRLYRADQLDQLSDADLDTLRADGIHLVCDLRTDAERARGMNRLPPGAESLIADVSGPGSTASELAKAFTDARLAERMLGGGKGAGLLIAANRQFVSGPSALLAYGDVFERLANPAMLPAVFHCTAGKDRTGWAQAIFLGIMGVPRETIMADYLLSNRYLAAKNEHMTAMLKGHVDPAWLKPLLEVRPEYLNAAFDEVDKRYGSMEAYLHQGLGLSDATLTALRHEFLAGS